MTKSGFPPSRLQPYRAAQSFHEALIDGTIGAIVDETPYLRLFLKSYCDNFTGSQFTSASLSFCSFWGLFLITGATSLLCAAVHLATFVVANRRPIRDASHGWRGRFLKLFDEKDLSSHTFKGRTPVAARSPAGTPSMRAPRHRPSRASATGRCRRRARRTEQVEIELAAAAGWQAEDEVTFAPNPPDAIIGGQNGTSHQLAQEEVAAARNPDGSSRDQNDGRAAGSN
ncbi:hypothetical protein PR202_ga15814 [Eleusine coracana subsp. coracana]|uniref:Uncharacterized protein n=1 Tax=Eleusine coracana subsp. coracana TaxID=191504 RepID=A0AAV5CL71_ELECO|nr:hypothetical protein PR202_ga15814 [Eleusine coracana subsp. coracana]